MTNEIAAIILGVAFGVTFPFAVIGIIEFIHILMDEP